VVFRGGTRIDDAPVVAEILATSARPNPAAGRLGRDERIEQVSATDFRTPGPLS